MWSCRRLCVLLPEIIWVWWNYWSGGLKFATRSCRATTLAFLVQIFGCSLSTLLCLILVVSLLILVQSIWSSVPGKSFVRCFGSEKIFSLEWFLFPHVSQKVWAIFGFLSALLLFFCYF